MLMAGVNTVSSTATLYEVDSLLQCINVVEMIRPNFMVYQEGTQFCLEISLHLPVWQPHATSKIVPPPLLTMRTKILTQKQTKEIQFNINDCTYEEFH